MAASLAGLWLLCAGLPLGGCDARSEEREAARRYGEVAARTASLQDIFLARWDDSRSSDDVATLCRTGREQVLPALRAYVAALSAMAPASPELAALHVPLVKAWQRFETRLASYYDKVNEANLPKRNARLENAWSELGARIVAYRNALRGYYEGLGLRRAGGGEATR